MLLFGLFVLLCCLSDIVRTQSPIRPALPEKSLSNRLKHQIAPSTTTTTMTPTLTASPEEITHSPNVTDHPSNTTSIPAHFPPTIPALLSLPLLLAALLVWRKLKRQRTAAGVSPKREEEELVCYAQLTLHPCVPEPTCANVTSQKSPSASRSPEVASEYSSIRRPKAEL